VGDTVPSGRKQLEIIPSRMGIPTLNSIRPARHQQRSFNSKTEENERGHTTTERDDVVLCRGIRRTVIEGFTRGYAQVPRP